jgi:hypothetical protein
MGKHGFLILTEPGGELPDDTRSYLQVIKPEPVYSQKQVFNFAWILGDVSEETVQELDQLLRVSSPFEENNSSFDSGDYSKFNNIHPAINIFFWVIFLVMELRMLT